MKSIDDHKVKMIQKFSNSKVVLKYIEDTLNSFCYRYLDTSQDINSKVTMIDNTFILSTYEPEIMEALKAEFRPVKEIIINLAKKFAQSEVKPVVKYSLEVDILFLGSQEGKLKIRSIVNTNFPDFELHESTCIKKESLLEFSEVMMLRKDLPILLEDLCEIFI